MATRIWVDQDGRTVEIRTFFSKTYIDEEVRRVSEQFQIYKCDGKQRLSTLGKCEKETLAARVLGLVIIDTTNPICLVGVRKGELMEVARREDEDWYVEELIEDGFLREKRIKGVVVVFPTEKLLDNQKIPRRPVARPPA